LIYTAAGRRSSRCPFEARPKRLFGFAILAPDAYLRLMLGFDFCIPTAGKRVPAAAEWFHEIKYDGYRSVLNVTVTACG
jgi:hypothetical protein